MTVFDHSLSEMIGLDAYRAVIGNWLFKTQKAQKLKNATSEAETRTFLGTYFLLILRLLFLGGVLFAVNTTIRGNSRIIREEETSLMPYQSLQTQLVVGNVELHPGPQNNLCDFCGARFTRIGNLKRHMNSQHFNNFCSQSRSFNQKCMPCFR